MLIFFISCWQGLSKGGTLYFVFVLYLSLTETFYVKHIPFCLGVVFCKLCCISSWQGLSKGGILYYVVVVFCILCCLSLWQDPFMGSISYPVLELYFVNCVVFLVDRTFLGGDIVFCFGVVFCILCCPSLWQDQFMGGILYPVLELYVVNCVVFLVEQAFLRGTNCILFLFCILYFVLYFSLTGPFYGKHIVFCLCVVFCVVFDRFCILYFALYFPLTGPLYGGHIAQTVGTLPFR